MEQVENDLIAAGLTALAGPLWITSNWVVALAPDLKIHSPQDLAGLGIETTTTKTGTALHLRDWLRDSALSEKVPLGPAEAAAVRAATLQRMSSVVIEDTESFDRRWLADRVACAREADVRRASRASASDSPRHAPGGLDTSKRT